MDATLTDLVDRVDRVIDAHDSDTRWRTVAAERVRELRAAWVVQHASSDGDGGLYHDLAETEPRVEPMVQRLRDESRQVIECCDFALAALAHKDAPPAEATHALQELVERARRYRSHVTTATHEAVSVDLGCG